MLSRPDILAVLGGPDGHAEELFAEARALRRRHFADTVFLYGFLYISSFCRNNCRFCSARRDNDAADRYRKTTAATLEHAGTLAESGVHLIDVAAGEDPGLTISELSQLLVEIKGRTDLPLMASVGVLDQSALTALQCADWYACYQETHNRSLFGKLRQGQDYDERYRSKVTAADMGFLIEEGIMTGIGETDNDLVDSMEAMAALDADQVRAMSLVPQPGTPMQDAASPPAMLELVTIALLRICFPDRLIPASLDVAGLAGLQQRLNAGANVVTSIIPPRVGLAGVANSSLGIDDGSRTIEALQPVLRNCDLRAATSDEYANWTTNRKARSC